MNFKQIYILISLFIFSSVATFAQISKRLEKKFDGTILQLPNPLSPKYLITAGQAAGQSLPKMTDTSWIQSFPNEPEQSFRLYASQSLNNETKRRDLGLPSPKTLYVLPLKKFSGTKREAVEKAAEFLSLFYGADVRVIEDDSVPEFKKNSKGQINVDNIIDNYLPKQLPSLRSEKGSLNPISLIGVTDDDLYTIDNGKPLNFVFGISSDKNPTQAWSLHRFGNPNGSDIEKRKYIERAVRISTHETGHQLGLPHTKTHRCILNGYNNLEDLDTSPAELCPEDSSKIWLERKLDPRKRYEALIAWAKTNKLLESEIKIWESALMRLNSIENHDNTQVLRPSSSQ